MDRGCTRYSDLIYHSVENLLTLGCKEHSSMTGSRSPADARPLSIHACCRGRSFLLFAAVKVFALVAQLLWVLTMGLPRAPDYILVQNPPSIPALLVVWLACLLRRANMVIDWHNLGFSMLALSLNRPSHPLVKVRTALCVACLAYDPPLVRWPPTLVSISIRWRGSMRSGWLASRISTCASRRPCRPG
jgi:hypothetical protein